MGTELQSFYENKKTEVQNGHLTGPRCYSQQETQSELVQFL